MNECYGFKYNRSDCSNVNYIEIEFQVVPTITSDSHAPAVLVEVSDE